MDESIHRHADFFVSAFTSSPIAVHYWIHYLFCSLLTIFMKLCLIRGLVAAVKFSFASEDMNVKDEAHGSPCSLENFLSQWNGWLEFKYGTFVERKKLPYRKLCSIVFSDRASAFADFGIFGGRYLSILLKATDMITPLDQSQVTNGPKWLLEIGQCWTSHRIHGAPSLTPCSNRTAYECGNPQ